MQFTLLEYGGPGFVTAELNFLKESLMLKFDLITLQNQKRAVSEQRPDIQWPVFTGLQRADDLWQNTCFELFLGNPADDSYFELNISSSGQWNCYAFDRYRTGMRQSDAVTVTAISSTKHQSLSVTLEPVDELILPLFIAPTVVTKAADGEMSYFAEAHAEKPDFHQRKLHRLVSDTTSDAL